MNAVGIDVSKGKSTVTVMRPFGEAVFSPLEVAHTDKDLTNLAKELKSLQGETRVVMEYTGYYRAPVAVALHETGIYVSAVNAMLVHDYGNNSLRRVKTDKKDAIKLANCALDQWLSLPQYLPEGDTRLVLKTCYRQYEQFSKMRTMQKDNLISLLDVTFPAANQLFSSPPRVDGSEKWVGVVAQYWHCECVCSLSQNAFAKSYEKWCRKHGYNFSENKAFDIYTSVCGHICIMPKCESTKPVVQQAVAQLQVSSAALATLKKQMNDLASTLPEYLIVMQMHGVGPSLGL